VSSALDTAKLDKITGSNSHILTIASNGSAVADSGLVAGSATLDPAPNSTTLATEAAVKDYADSQAAQKLDKLGSSTDHNDKVAFFTSAGQAVTDKGYGVDVNSFATIPSSATLATEAAVADYVTSALQEIAWVTL